MDCCPHVARFRDRVVGEHTCGADEARKLVASLRALLRVVGPAVNRPNFVRGDGLDSVAQHLDRPFGPDGPSVVAERLRQRLMGEGEYAAATPPRVLLKRRTHEVIYVHQAERLDDR